MLIVISIILQAMVVLWALYTKIRKKALFELAAVAICGFALVLNGFVAFFTSSDFDIPGIIQYARFTLLSFMVPAAYMYFARKIGRQWNNYILSMLWLLVILVFFPYIVVVIDQGAVSLSNLVLEPYRTYFIFNGRTIINAYTSDIVMAVQGLVTVALLVPMLLMIRRYGLDFTNKMKIFFAWWGCTVLYIVYSSFVTPEDLSSVVSYWIYFGSYFVITVTIFTLVALDFDMDPLVMAITGDSDALDVMGDDDDEMEDMAEGIADVSVKPVPAAEPVSLPAAPVSRPSRQDEQVSVGLDAFISLCHEMATRLKTLIYEDKAYVNPDFKAEDAIQFLGTNRTYFARMMSAEFGCKFSDLINEERLRHAHDLLETTDKSISDIAAESGFRDASYFSKKFSQKYGMSPKQFRSE